MHECIFFPFCMIRIILIMMIESTKHITTLHYERIDVFRDRHTERISNRLLVLISQ